TDVRARSALRRRSSNQSGKYDPSRSLGIATSRVPARVSNRRGRYPPAAIGALLGHLSVPGAADRVGVGRHQRIDEGREHLAQQIRGRLGKVVFKKTGRVDIVMFDGHRRWSFRGSCLRLLKGSHGDRHPSPDYRPPLISYTKLLDAPLPSFQHDQDKSCNQGVNQTFSSPAAPGPCSPRGYGPKALGSLLVSRRLQSTPSPGTRPPCSPLRTMMRCSCWMPSTWWRWGPRPWMRCVTGCSRPPPGTGVVRAIPSMGSPGSCAPGGSTSKSDTFGESVRRSQPTLHTRRCTSLGRPSTSCARPTRPSTRPRGATSP